MAKFKKKNEAGKLVPISHSPVPELSQVELSFPDAIKEVINGRKITRLGWNNQDYCLLRESWLTIFINGEFKQWIVNDGDLFAIDWVALPDSN